MWSRLSLMYRIMLLCSFGILVVGAVAIVLNRMAIEDAAMEGMLEKSRAITIQALNNMNYVAELRNRYQVIDEEKIHQEIEKLQQRRFASEDEKRRAITETAAYWSIPVVAAWTVAQRDAEASHFEFRTPRVQARNPKNEADPLERRMLDTLRNSNQSEIFEIDKDMNAFRYIKPVRLQRDCLVCHGTMADDPDGDGVDFFGYRMEGWKEGEVRGGFEIVVDLKPMQERVNQSTGEILLFTLAALGISLVLVFLATKHTIAEPIRRLMERLSQMAYRTGTAAQQVSSLSDALATSSTEQAASLEETSSAMTEIDSQTRENAENAGVTSDSVQQLFNSLQQVRGDSQTSIQAATEARKAVEEGMEAMHFIVKALADINSSGEKINAIVELLSSITQQTKMLATNAAVEAARAGEQGKGFGVVADEVAKLAENSKQAARDISSLVHESTNRTNKGNELAARGEEALQKILEKFDKVSAFINELSRATEAQAGQISQVQRLATQIKDASNSQAIGIDEITRAVHQMDDLTQSNAARAEETAAASQMMLSEADTLSHIIQDLENLITGMRRAQRLIHGNQHRSGSDTLPQLPSYDDQWKG